MRDASPRKTAMRLAALLALSLLVTPAAAGDPAGDPASSAAPFDAEAWISDLRQTRQAMGSHYANLDWAVTEREAPLGRLFAAGEQRLRTASSDAEAREVFERLERYLGDGHVSFDWPAAALPPTALAGALPPPAATPSPCETLGFRNPGRDGQAVSGRLPGHRPLEGESGFPAGLTEVNGRLVGVVRIAELSAQAHPGACAAALAGLGLNDGEACEDDCLVRLHRLAVDRVTGDLAGRLRALAAAGAEALLVDLAGNGGGSEWTEVAVRLFSPLRLRSARIGFPRHPHWVERFAQDERRLAEIARGEPPEDRARLEAYVAVLAQARREAAEPCDPEPWFAAEARPTCAWLTTAPLYATGPAAELDPDLVGKSWAAEVFTPLLHRFEPGVWTGPLIVLVDHNTASAAEEFVAVLQDNDAAVVIGSPTFGAGCGHARGEIVTVLAHSGARLRLPNCARLRADGSNEVGGITPDLLIGFRQNDGPNARTRRLAAALPGAVAAAQAQFERRAVPPSPP